MTRTISNTDDLIDVRDIIEAVEEGNAPDELVALLDNLKGNGGDHQWRGDWYPVTLISEYHFEDYARELAEDIGAIEKDAPWPTYHIDWEAAAKDLLADYSKVDFGGTAYYYR